MGGSSAAFSTSGTHVMPRFYFHHRTPLAFITDPDGNELSDIGAALAEALTSARHLWAEAIVACRDMPGESFEITGGDGQLLLTVPFRDALPPSLRT